MPKTDYVGTKSQKSPSLSLPDLRLDSMTRERVRSYTPPVEHFWLMQMLAIGNKMKFIFYIFCSLSKNVPTPLKY